MSLVDLDNDFPSNQPTFSCF